MGRRGWGGGRVVEWGRGVGWGRMEAVGGVGRERGGLRGRRGLMGCRLHCDTARPIDLLIVLSELDAPVPLLLRAACGAGALCQRATPTAFVFALSAGTFSLEAPRSVSDS